MDVTPLRNKNPNRTPLRNKNLNTLQIDAKSISLIPTTQKSRCPSKKRKKVLSSDVKIEESKRKKKMVEDENLSKQKQKSLLPFCTSKSSSFITITSSSQPYIQVREPFMDTLSTKSMNAQIAKSLKNNFQTSYVRKTERRSQRNKNKTLETKTLFNHVQLLDSYRRCIVEDFMTLPKGTEIIVLLPSSYMSLSPWKEHESDDLKTPNISFGSKKYIMTTATMSFSPYSSRVCDGMIRDDLEFGFANGNFGSYVNFNDFNVDRLITWSEVLHGRSDFLQVWARDTDMRDLLPLFEKKRRSLENLNRLVHNFYLEYYGDRLSISLMLNCYYKALNKQRVSECLQLKNIINAIEPPLLVGDAYDNLLSTVDNTFKNAIKNTYTRFCTLGGCLISSKERNNLIALYKKSMPSHYDTIKKIMGINLKEGLTRNKALKDTGFYDRRLFYQFLSQTRMRNPQSSKWWGIIAAAANYGHGSSREYQNYIGMNLGTTCSIQTFVTNTRSFVAKMEKSITELLSKETNVVGAIDNNQKGHNRTFQRGGSSNKFVKVTARFLRQAVNCKTINFEEHPRLSFVNQDIPSPQDMPPFELFDIFTLDSYLTPLTHLSSVEYNKIDISGKRTSRYFEIVNIVLTCKKIRKYLTGYNKSTDTFKMWVHAHDDFTSEYRNKVVLKMHSIKNNFLHNITSFQRNVVHAWNPSTLTSSKCFIPPVSTRDEIRTDGFGMAVIEILVYAGILVKTTDDRTKQLSWCLSTSWKRKNLFLCLDGLSLERHKSFQKRLTKLPISFKKAYQQGLIFRKALSRVIEMPGPLHQAFHLLQCIFNIYKFLIKWSMKVVGWKKINTGDVSQTFHLCVELMNIVKDELERLGWDMFLVHQKHEIDELMNEVESNDILCLKIAEAYQIYCANQQKSGRTDYVRYMFNFFISCK